MMGGRQQHCWDAQQLAGSTDAPDGSWFLLVWHESLPCVAFLTPLVTSLPAAVSVIFSKFDALRLERVVGSARSAKMLRERKTSTFLFC